MLFLRHARISNNIQYNGSSCRYLSLCSASGKPADDPMNYIYRKTTKKNRNAFIFHKIQFGIDLWYKTFEPEPPYKPRKSATKPTTIGKPHGITKLTKLRNGSTVGTLKDAGKGLLKNIVENSDDDQ